MKKLEAYLLRTGKFSLFFSPYFYSTYGQDIIKVVIFFRNWRVIEEGYRKYEAYRPFLKSYDWSFPKFEKILSICEYLGLIEIHQDKVTRATYIHLSEREFTRSFSFGFRKEVAHGAA